MGGNVTIAAKQRYTIARKAPRGKRASTMEQFRSKQTRTVQDTEAVQMTIEEACLISSFSHADILRLTSAVYRNCPASIQEVLGYCQSSMRETTSRCMAKK
jgi:hypothetical protein